MIYVNIPFVYHFVFITAIYFTVRKLCKELKVIPSVSLLIWW